MEKILDATFREALIKSLKEAGVNEDKALSIVTTQYKEAVKVGAINTLEIILKLIKEDKYDELIPYIRFSPAGDCMGSENYYISFDNCGLEDIGDVVNTLSGKNIYDNI